MSEEKVDERLQDLGVEMTSVLIANDWDPDSKVDIYRKGGAEVRCYIEIRREQFEWHLGRVIGYRVYVESPVAGGKRYFNLKLSEHIDTDKLLKKVGEVT